MRYQLFLFLILISLTKLAFAQGDKSILLPLAGNAYASGGAEKTVTENGIENWKDNKTSYKAYIRLAKTGTLTLKIKEASKIVGDNLISFGINKRVKILKLAQGDDYTKALGEWEIIDTGYVAIEIKGLSASSGQFPNITSLQLGGTAINDKTSYVKNNEGNFFYWGRRGPSVHLNYEIPKDVEAEWFYNEITVPTGEDVVGSYYMANGFAEGYFGIQVNSATERRILFSVWSPFTTDDPKSIPESDKIKLLKKGTDVYTGEFGNEGSGGQSYLKYNWKAGNTYKFLLHAKPGTPSLKPEKADGTVDIVYTQDSTTTYTAYFFAPELNQWKLIASFKRPKTQTYIKRPHSFLENFIPEMGDKKRKVLFGSQWICDSKGNWTELDKASFTIDNTGRVNYRKDYAGGLEGKNFYLQNCGFFNNFTPAKLVFTKPKTNNKPIIDFRKLN